MNALTQRIADLFLDGNAAELAALYAPDALVDISVPQWRYQILGRDVEELLRTDFDAADRIIGTHRVTGYDGGVAIELESHFTEDGETRRVRVVDLFHTDGDRIVEHTVYCTGIWDAATIARQAVEAPMVRR